MKGSDRDNSSPVSPEPNGGEAKGSGRIWNKAFIAIFMVALFQTMGQFVAHTLVPKYADSLGATASLIGLISGLYAGTALAFRPITSPTYDMFNKKDILTIALSVTTLSFVVFFLSRNITWIMIGRALQGLGIGVAGPMGLSIVASALPRESYSKGVSLYTVTQAFGQAIGPSIGLELSQKIGYQKTFLCSAALMLVAVILTRFCADTPVSGDKHYQVGFKNVFSKDAIPGAVVMLFACMPYASISAMMTIYGGLLGIEKIGLYFTFYAIGLLVFKPLLGGFADKYGFAKVMVGAMAVYAVAFVIFGFARTLPPLLIGALVAAAGYGVLHPTLQALCMRTALPENTGVAANTLYFFQDIGLFVGPYISGMAIDMFKAAGSEPADAYAKSFMLMVVPLAISAVLTIILRDVIKRNIKR